MIKNLDNRPKEEGKFTPIPPRFADENHADYYRRLLAGSLSAKNAHIIHETWVRRHQGGLRVKDCYQRIKKELEELMKSNFLRADYIDTGMHKDDCHIASEELRKLLFEDLLQIEGAEWKFALLNMELKKKGESRVLIDEQCAGLYIDEMRDKLSIQDIEAFFSFATFTSLAYMEINRIIESNDNEAKNATLQQTDEQIALNYFVNCIIKLANSTYDSWNGKIISPGANQPGREIIIKRDELVSYIKDLQQNHPEELLAWCYPPDVQFKIRFGKYVALLQDKGYFGALPNNLLAKNLAPILGMKEKSTSNYLSPKKKK